LRGQRAAVTKTIRHPDALGKMGLTGAQARASGNRPRACCSSLAPPAWARPSLPRR
jgi:hypothetical protein